MIQLNKVHFSYGSKAVLEELTIDFEERAVHGIIGLNGAGKTSLFQLLCGYEKPNSGHITFDGKTLKRSDIGFLETENYFYPKLTGADFLNIFPPSNTTFNQERLVEIFNLPLTELIEHYSTGMKKKLMLLSFIKQDKQVYILDEPFNGLDLEANKTLEIIIEQLCKKGKTLFISSHILDPLLHVCTNIHYLHHKKFQKTYAKKEFHLLNEEIFGKLKTKLESEIHLAI